MSIKHSLLALLRQEPCSASQLQARFASTTDDVWPLNIGQVSQTLTRLERDGLIEIAGSTTGPTGREAATYRLTATGDTAVTEWFRSAVITPADDRDELVIKLAMAATQSDLDVIAMLDTQRREALTQLRRVNQAARALPLTRTADRLQAERRIFVLEAEIRFLDRVEALTAPEAQS